LTASHFGDIVKATEKRDLQKLAESILNPTELCGEAVVHGRTYETVAIEKFEKLSSLKVTRCGLFINPSYPFLAASPDGVISSTAVIEVKCPFNGRNMLIKPGKFFPFLAQTDNCVSLKKNHKYYYQIQGQLGIARREHCFFVVYTHADIFIEKVIFDECFFLNEMLPKLEFFYKTVYRPHIAKLL